MNRSMVNVRSSTIAAALYVGADVCARVAIDRPEITEKDQEEYRLKQHSRDPTPVAAEHGLRVIHGQPPEHLGIAITLSFSDTPFSCRGKVA